MKRMFSTIALASAALVVLTACGAPAATEDTAEPTDATGLEEIERLAQEEGEVVWYTGTSPASAEKVAAAFEETYDIPVFVNRLTSADIAQRFQAEVNAGNVEADVLLTVDERFFLDMREQGLTKELSAEDFDGYPEEYILGDGAAATSGINVYVVPYNTDVLGDFAPESWDDFLDERLKGQLLITDPRGSNAWAQWWSVILRAPELGEDYLTAIRDQEFRLAASTVPGIELLAASEGALLIAATVGSMTPAVDAGAPLEYTVPEGPTVTGRNWVAIAEDAPHPNAAFLFTHWLLSEDGSQLYNELETSASPLGDLPGVMSLPDGALPPPSADQVQEDLPKVLSLLGIQ